MAINTQGITPSDLIYALELFDGLSIDRARLRFAYDLATDTWKILDGDTNNVVATRPPTDSQWEEL